MKHIFLTLAVVLLTANLATAQDTDREQIETTLNYYLEGGTNNDFETLKKAFHETATMKFMAKDGYKEVNALEFFGSRMKPGPAQDRTTKIESIDLMGNAAHAKLVIDYPSFSFIDYMNLLKVDGEWKIVGKIFYRKQKAL
ncbi:nuclear transport factor 2 family protein [Poritiphilus flavus]|uniref:Nuclear transport factor 2 family protein n=1 Tax=Poritiphilus flavus TaxID=2697053 RepID=A0A6L9EBL0_9FLAO|nr:nuclear transport factor 2 family protein [Poritiphilus flavus]NAS12137.1 nuclear transport factor 2 family protein [Poritiphilus flavus]